MVRARDELEDCGTENYIISNNRKWEDAHNSDFTFLGISTISARTAGTGIVTMFLLFGLFYVTTHVRRKRAKVGGRLLYPKDEESGIPYTDSGVISCPDGYTKQYEGRARIPHEAEPLKKKYLHVLDEGLGKKDCPEKPVKKTKSTPVGGAKKKLSAYNQFMQTEMERLKESHSNITHKERFSKATSNWKTSKENPKNV